MPTYAKLVFLPVFGYLAIMFFVAVFVTTPPTVGWIGLGVVALVALTGGTIVAVLYPRTRANQPHTHPDATHGERVLVVADAHCTSPAFARAVRSALLGREAGDTFVVAPVLSSPLRFLTESESDEAGDARVRLSEALATLGHHGIFARGMVGSDDPLAAIADALAVFPATEIVIVESEASRTWLEEGIAHQARDLFGVHVSTVPAAAAPQAA